MECHCTSNFLIPVLPKLKDSLKQRKDDFLKKGKKVGGILKEAILNKENEDNSDEHDETETFLKCLSKHIVILVIVVTLFILVKVFC